MNHLFGFKFEISLPLLCGLAILLSRNEINAQNQTACTLRSLNATLPTTIREVIDQSISNAKNFDGDSMLFLTYLLKYELIFPERKGKTPLETNYKAVYKPNLVHRVLNRHGSTLLGLAFNSAVVSLMTLNIGTKTYSVTVVERPARCLDGLGENETLNVVLYLVARDFNHTAVNSTLGNDDKVCVNYIQNVDGKAKFTARCFLGDDTDSMESQAARQNLWLSSLYITLAVIRAALLFFGPVLLISYAADLSSQSVPYVVKLKESLYRSMFIAKSLKDFERVRGRRILDLGKCRGYPKLKEAMLACPMGVPFMAEIFEYDILAAKKRLIKENEVPVTIWSAISEAIFSCKMKNVAGIKECCYTDMFKSMPCVKKKVAWVNCCYKLGLLLLILFMPCLYYLRLFVFYVFEKKEADARIAAGKNLNLTKEFDYNIFLYFRPTHPLFLSIYAVYVVSAIILAFLTQRDHEDRFRNIVVGSFQDLDQLSYLKVLKMAADNILWPFRRFGCLGIFVALGYWVVFIPWTLIVCMIYSLPTVYLLVRMTFYSRKAFLQTIRTRSGVRRYQANAKFDETIDVFKTDFLLGDDKNANPDGPRSSGPRGSGPQEADEMEKFRAAEKKDDDKDSVASSIIHTIRIKPTRFAMHCLSAVVCVITMLSLLIIVSECVGALAEIAIFTLMGIIANAGVTVRYVTLAMFIFFYSYNCFRKVKDKYLRLNRFLFPELKNRIPDLFNVTALPSHLQENEAFKSQLQSQQAAHEYSDDIAETPARHWLINDLTLFVDNHDTFRIPRRLFKDVCEIDVAGVPGPVHLGILESIYSFLQILMFLLFVLVVIQSFGSVYEVSNSVQTTAIVGSGFLPILLDRFLSSTAPEVDVNTLSFTSKLDEVVKNFWQLWPIHDFAFRVAGKTDLPEHLTKKLILEKGTPKGPAGFNTAATGQNLQMESKGGLSTAVTGPTLQMESQGGINTAATEAILQMGSEMATVRDSKAQPIPENVNMHNRFYQRGLATAAVAAVASTPTPTPYASAAVQQAQVGKPQAAAAAPPPPPATPKTIDLIINKQKVTIELVDILIRIPAKYEDQWIDGWSNIVDYRDVKKDKRESDVADTMLAAAAQSRKESDNKTPKQGGELTDI